MKLSIIIVSFNVRYFLEQALLSVQKAIEGIEAEIFVVDNNSQDDSVLMVQQQFPAVRLLVNPDNPGFAKANNQAVKMAKGEYILLLNPDTLIEEDTFEKCIQFMDEHPDAGALGVRMIDGSGLFLPESKRGLPTPLTAFFKMSGISKIFPKSAFFNRYYLGHLDRHKNLEVEILAGAFMFLRARVLKQIGLLDESFFMYGEDIDLSYRITQAGFKNFYFSNTTILHYKGESTKKGSLNYVRVFYTAMIIFAKKHFRGKNASIFVFLLKIAIYFRALFSLLGTFLKKIALPLMDALLIFGGMYWLKDFWATSYFDDPNYYRPSFLFFNIPLYMGGWVGSIYFYGGYDEPGNIRKLVKGMVFGSVLLAAIYGFLPLEYRTSRMLLLLGSVWTMLVTFTLRLLLHFWNQKNFNIGQLPVSNLIIVGDVPETERVQKLMAKARKSANFLGIVTPNPTDHSSSLGTVAQLVDIVALYQIDEIIFCSKNNKTQSIIQWMTQLGNHISYRIVPEGADSIIGSDSKNEPGELYTADIRYNITETVRRRSKRLLDLVVAIMLLLFSPLLLFFIRKRNNFFKNIFSVLLRKKTWVGYFGKIKSDSNLPFIPENVLSPAEGLPKQMLNHHTIARLNFFYARDYDWTRDLELIWKGFRNLGN